MMPERFQFPYRATMTDVWIPSDLPLTRNWFQRIDVAVGRLTPGVTLEAAGEELAAIARRVGPSAASNPVRTVPIIPLAEAVTGRSRTALLTLFGAAAMVLLMACANVANLLLGRADARKREVAVRIALGAGRARLLQQFLVESGLLALAASAAAVFIAFVGTKVLVALAGDQVPRAVEIGFDWTAFTFLLTIGVGTGGLFGLVPALRAISSDVGGVLNALDGRSSAGRESLIVSKGLVVGEIALAFILLTGAGLLFSAVRHLQRVPVGLVAEHVLTLRLETRGVLPPHTPSERAGSPASVEGRYFRAIEERVMQIPGVRAAGFVTRLHVQSPGNTATFTVVGQPPAPNDNGGAPVRLREASAGYFRALGIPVRAGRLFTDLDTGVIVNEALVRRHFPGEDPIGRVLSRGTIVGVVGDVRQRLRLPPEPEIYVPLTRTGYSAATLVVDAETSPEMLIGSVRAAIREINPHQTIYDVTTMEDVIRSSHADVHLSLWLVGLFAGLALVLSMAGIYGVMSYAATVRRREYGIRLALGANAARLLRLVLAQGGLLVGAGVAIGVAGAVAVTRVLSALLYEVTPTDPLTFIGAALLLAGVAMLACLNPAIRAMRLDPMSILRHE
jgi:predicted permease